MTYADFIRDFNIQISEAFFDVLVKSFDAQYGTFTSEHGIYDAALVYFILHNDKLKTKLSNATSRSVGGVSVTNTITETQGETNYLSLLENLLVSQGWGNFSGFVATGRSDGCS